MNEQASTIGAWNDLCYYTHSDTFYILKEAVDRLGLGLLITPGPDHLTEEEAVRMSHVEMAADRKASYAPSGCNIWGPPDPEYLPEGMEIGWSGNPSGIRARTPGENTGKKYMDTIKARSTVAV